MLLPSPSIKQSAVVISGSQYVEQVQCGSGGDNIVQEMVIIEALPPLQVWLPQLGPAQRHACSGTVIVIIMSLFGARKRAPHLAGL